MAGFESFDVVIVGGGVIGSSIAFFLAEEPDFAGSIAVIERDPTYVDSSTARSVGGIRQQFSTPENIEIAKFGAAFFKTAGERLAVGEERPDLAFCESGYLLLASRDGRAILQQNHALQVAHGAAVTLLEPAALEQRFPWLRTEDLVGGSLGLRDEGWIDPYSLLMAFKRKAESLGVVYLQQEVVALPRRGARVTGVQLRDGARLACGSVVDAAGPGAAKVAALAGIEDCPVRPRKRLVFTFECREPMPDCPLVVDPCGLYFRPEGDKFLCGASPPPDQDPDSRDLKVDPHYFEEMLWPALAHRVPAFDALREGTAWAGHYAVNVLDHNAILGPHPEVENFYFANGFSGHGLQQAPAVGRALAETIASGTYRTLDLNRFGFSRFATGRLIEERNVI
ncbi:MAG: FAD-binding oxidoreductase [Acidobacteriota bacterium]